MQQDVTAMERRAESLSAEESTNFTKSASASNALVSRRRSHTADSLSSDTHKVAKDKRVESSGSVNKRFEPDAELRAKIRAGTVDIQHPHFSEGSVRIVQTQDEAIHSDTSSEKIGKIVSYALCRTNSAISTELRALQTKQRYKLKNLHNQLFTQQQSIASLLLELEGMSNISEKADVKTRIKEHRTRMEEINHQIVLCERLLEYTGEQLRQIGELEESSTTRHTSSPQLNAPKGFEKNNRNQ